MAALATYLLSESAANVTAHSLTYPATSAGDMMIAVAAVDSGPTAVIVTGFSTWTPLISDTSSGTHPRVSAFWKIADGTEEGTPEAFTTDKAEQMIGGIFVASGADVGSAPDYGYSTGTEASANYAAATATMPSVKDYLVLTGLFLNRNSQIDIIGIPDNYTDITGSQSVLSVAMGMQRRNVTASSATPTGSYTTGVWDVVNLGAADPSAPLYADYSTFTIAIHPASGGRSKRLMLMGAG